MRWTWLGHACWLAELSGCRILFDPVLGDTYHDGVFFFRPRRTIDLSPLKPDIIIVTHRHPDHFDLPSLAQLAELAPDALVITSESLVAGACERLGFEVRTVDAWQRINFPDAVLLTTPSRARVKEWGVMVKTDAGVVWNQVDTVLGGQDGVRSVLRQASELLEYPSLVEEGPTLTLAHWQPLKQVEVVRAGSLGFPGRNWGQELAQLAALGGGAVIPAAANQDYTGEGAWQRHHAFPSTPGRLARDLRRLDAPVEVLPATVGGIYRVSASGVELEPDSSGLVAVESESDPRVFAPFEIPPIVDPNREAHDPDLLRAALSAWVEQRLVPSLAQGLGPHGPLCCVLEWVFPDGRETWTLRVEGQVCTLESGEDFEWDLRLQAAASPVFEVLCGRSHWGRPLLGGLMRAANRAYDPVEKCFMRVNPFFLYYGLSYDQATERWVEHLLTELGK